MNRSERADTQEACMVFASRDAWSNRENSTAHMVQYERRQQCSNHRDRVSAAPSAQQTRPCVHKKHRPANLVASGKQFDRVNTNYTHMEQGGLCSVHCFAEETTESTPPEISSDVPNA